MKHRSSAPSRAPGLASAIDPDAPFHPRLLMNHLGLSPRRSMGQNFLTSVDILQQLVARAGVSAERWVLEVGPGLGALTSHLAATGARVIALEKDRGLAAHLTHFFEHHPNVTIVQTDALEWNLQELPEGQGQVVANLPYNVAIPILFHLLQRKERFADLHLMVQKEVAERMAAAPDTDEYGALSVNLQLLADVETVLEVPPGAFYPPPKVTSSVVRVTPLPGPRFEVGSLKVFDRMVKASFGERRKTLRNALKALFPKETVERALTEAALEGQRRGETLSLSEFCRLSRSLYAAQSVTQSPESSSQP